MNSINEIESGEVEPERKAVNPKDRILKNIESKVQDDLDENLNINAWLGEDDETKADDAKAARSPAPAPAS